MEKYQQLGRIQRIPRGNPGYAKGIHIHQGGSSWSYSQGCLTVYKDDWNRFISLFPVDPVDTYEGSLYYHYIDQINGVMSMKRSISIAFIYLIYIISSTTYGAEVKFPNEEIKNISIIELASNESYDFSSYTKIDLNIQKKYSGVWSTLNYINLDMLKITAKSSSTLGKGYSASNICDKKLETAWVEGVKGNGIGELVKIELYAEKESPSTTPFSVEKIGVLCGYGKSSKTWDENNRVKSLLLVVHSPSRSYPQEHEWVAYCLLLEDEPKLQLFKLPDDEIAINMEPMVKDIWIKIEDIYPGTKYDDTCISELVIIGGCLP